MDLHLVSGFLGGGKTTSIVNLCKVLMRSGLKVAVVTNDQGKYLVDTAFINASNIPAVDVQSGCFCSNYQDLVKQIDELQEKVHPDVIFAESIGSSGNLIGTVMEPLLTSSSYHPKSLTAIADSRLLLRLVENKPLPFSDSVTALYTSQINESDCLIINKIDLISEGDILAIKQAVPQMFPGKIFLFQDAFIESDIRKWYATISQSDLIHVKDPGFDIERHQRALGRLKWHEKIYQFNDNKDVHDAVIHILETFSDRLKSGHYIIAHLKCLITTAENDIFKLSLTALDESNWEIPLEDLHSKRATMLVNARIHTDDDITPLFS